LPSYIGVILFTLCLLDLSLTAVAFFFPSCWFEVFHGSAHVDPQGLLMLRRCGANWAAFALFQFVALFKWRKQPVWLAVVAGMRLGDILTDWTYLAFAQNLTWPGWLMLGIASPGNLVIGLRLLKWHKRARV
jgi:hypothetical protein